MRRGAADAKKKTVWAFWHQPTNCRGSSGPGAPASFAAFALFPPGESPTATDRPTDRPTDRSTGGPRGAASERAARARGAAGIVFLRMCGRCQVPQPELQVAISYVVFRTALSELCQDRAFPPCGFTILFRQRWLVGATSPSRWLAHTTLLSLVPSPCHCGPSYHCVRHRRSPPAMASKKVDETTTLRGVDDDDEKLPEWVVKYGAPLAITFYILVAVVKTMLTKVRLSTFDTVGNHSSRWVT